VLTRCAALAHVDAYSPALEPVWSTVADGYARGMCLHADAVWILDGRGTSAYQQTTGKRISRIDFPIPGGMWVGGFVPTIDGFVVALEHDHQHPIAAPLLMRVKDAGDVQWMCTLPAGDITYSSLEFVGGRLRPLRAPIRTWRLGLFSSALMTISGDAVLVVYSDNAIDMGYVVSLKTGEFRYHTQSAGHIMDVAALGGGEFLVGCWRSGVLPGEEKSSETHHYGRAGKIANRWPTCGAYVVGDDVRVIESANGDRPAHIARLQGGAGITRGDWLEGRSMSRPFICLDGLVCFVRYGLLHKVRELTVVDCLTLADAHDEQYMYQLDASSDSVYISWIRYTANVLEFELVRIEV